MRLLLDTHVVLWQLSGQRELGPRAQATIKTAEELLFSVVSFAEIGVKAAIGKLTVPADLHALVLDAGVRQLGLTAEDGLRVGALPLHHRDPFDRLLIAQAQRNDVVLMSADARISAYDVELADPLL